MKRLVLVTGAARGIGRATVTAFIEHGWEVLSVDTDEIVTTMPGEQAFMADVADIDTWIRLLQELNASGRQLDALVNNAGIMVAKGVTEFSTSDYEKVMNVNFRSIFNSVTVLADRLATPGGRIVNVSSVHARATSAGKSLYAASKGAVNAYSRAIALELAPRGILVNCICPGAVDTDMLRGGFGYGDEAEQHIELLRKLVPTRRIASPDQIAAMIYLLCDVEQTAEITGQEIYVDGGASLLLGTEPPLG